MKQPLNEQFRRMQKLAGIITENELKVGDTPEGGDEGGDEGGRYRSDVDWYYVDENSNYPGPKGRVIPVAAGYEDPRNFDGTELYIAKGTTGNKIGDKFEDDEGNDVEFKKEYFNSISY